MPPIGGECSMRYKVLKPFRCEKGQLYPGDTVELHPGRAAKLKTVGLVADMSVVAETATIEPPEKAVMPGLKPKHIGGGWYELPNGEKVRGKEEAEEAMERLGDG